MHSMAPAYIGSAFISLCRTIFLLAAPHANILRNSMWVGFTFSCNKIVHYVIHSSRLNDSPHHRISKLPFPPLLVPSHSLVTPCPCLYLPSLASSLPPSLPSPSLLFLFPLPHCSCLYCFHSQSPVHQCPHQMSHLGGRGNDFITLHLQSASPY